MSRYFTKEEIDLAKNASMAELMQLLGIPIKHHSGREYCLVEHDSLKLSGNKWYWNSQKVGGNPIDFLMKYPGCSCSFLEAIGIILGRGNLDRSCDLNNPVVQDQEAEKEEMSKTFLQPLRNDNNNRVIAYLNQTRGIDYEIIKDLITMGKLYEEGKRLILKDGKIRETSKTHNAVFVGYDVDGEMRYAFRRGTVSGKKFAGEVIGSDKRYAFRMEGITNTVCVFESAIDALSYFSIKKMHGEKCQDWLLSLGGGSLESLDQFLINHPNISSIEICTDNDKSGNYFAEKIIGKYEKEYSVSVNLPKLKDYNEDLIHFLEAQR